MKKITKYMFLLVLITSLLGCDQKARHVHQEAVVRYTCPMHPQIVQDKPGTCPICGMELVKVNPNDNKSIVLTESQIRLANITTTLTRFENIGEDVLLTGKLRVNEEQTETVSSRVQGRIEKLYFKESGQRVTKGQVLYEIYSENLQTLQQEYLLALRQSEEMKDSRYRSFLESSEKKLLLLGMTVDQVKQVAKARKVSSRLMFLSPLIGIISQVDVTEGEYVEEGTGLYRIDNLDKIWVEGDLYPGESSLVTSGDVVRVQIAGFENAAVSGKVTFLSPEYRQGTQIVTLRAVIDNPHHNFLPGTQATIILSHSTKKAIALPPDAVIREENGSHVWILEQDGSFRPQMVTTGLENFEKVEIMEGLGEKENVVITGAYLLYSELVLKRGMGPMDHHPPGENK